MGEMEDMQRQVDVRGCSVSLAMRERGAGPDLLLFIHGLGCAKESFAGAWDRPEWQDCSLLAVDLPGHGRSELPAGFRADMEGYADVLRALLRAIPRTRLHVVAHSMGGAVGLLATSGDPTLASFVNVEGNLIAEDCGLLSRRMAGTPVGDVVGGGFERLVQAATGSVDPDIRMWARWAASAHPRAFHEASVSLVHWSDSGRLLGMMEELPVPRCYVYGTRSVIPAVLARLHRIQRLEIKGAGHGMMEECPEAFYSVVAEWLTTQTAIVRACG